MNNCEVVTKPVLNLVGISYCGPYSTFPDEAIRLQSEVLARKHEVDYLSSAIYSPYFGNEVFATYWACFEVAHIEEPPAGMVQFTIPEGQYAMVRTTNERIGEGYEQLFAWMNERQLIKRESAVSLEIFYIDERLEEELVELLIPIVPIAHED
ncbi:GyrI-like domain-containing protein [Paenibacillus sp. GCM10027626]|uniref:GyrI-like domain-containing protein n=1 Tax=Paenibacillus sp. GCM10027626 TaxID=3273411 RepID=UPI00363D448C